MRAKLNVEEAVYLLGGLLIGSAQALEPTLILARENLGKVRVALDGSVDVGGLREDRVNQLVEHGVKLLLGVGGTHRQCVTVHEATCMDDGVGDEIASLLLGLVCLQRLLIHDLALGGRHCLATVRPAVLPDLRGLV